LDQGGFTVKLLAVSFAFLAAGTAIAQPAATAPAAAPATPAADPAILFGVRENVEQIDLSPDGRRVVYLQPGPGRSTAAWLYDLAGGGAPTLVTRTDGNPERLRWCRFATNDRLICRVAGMTRTQDVLVPFSRLISMDTDGTHPQLLGQRQSYFDAAMRQYDGSILDWSGTDGAVMMERQIVPEVQQIGSRVGRTGDGLAVERIDLRTLRTTRIEPPNPRAGGYISDGRGNVRIMTMPTERTNTGMLGTRTNYMYRTAGSHDWQVYCSYDSAGGEGM
jgi:hypothetical protein